VANAISNRGQVVGTSGIRAFLWEDGEMRDLGAVSGTENAGSRGNAINERGQVAGSSQTDVLTSTGGRVTHATLWDRERAIDLGTLGEPTDFSVAFGLNERAEVVGESVVGRVGSTTVYHAFLWAGGWMIDLHPEALGLRHSRATAVNDHGEAVGHASGFYGFPTIDGKAVLWRNGVAVDLNQRIPAGSGWVLRSAERIDAAGHIVGYGSFEGQTRAFLLVPQRGR
jgi:probable HAF family extracellular repeat protein